MSSVRPEEAREQLELLRQEAARRGFGVTLIGRDMTLRWAVADGTRHLEATFVCVGVTDSDVKRCDSCGETTPRLYDSESYLMLACDRRPTRMGKVRLCYDCWCPK